MQALLSFLQEAKTRKAAILSVFAAIYAIKKIYPLMVEAHSRKKRDDPDEQLFPSHFRNKQGLWIFRRDWEIKDPKAHVFLCHGYGEHIGRYEHFARVLNSQGYSVHGIDHQGHGQSDGDRGYMVSLDDLVDDYVAFARQVPTGKLPCFLIGHSMGGLIATFVAQKAPMWRAVVLSGPLFALGDAAPSSALIAVASYISYFFPKLTLSKVSSSLLSKHPQVAQQYDADPLNYHEGVRARTGYNFLVKLKQAIQLAPQVEWPFLLLHGQKDGLVSVEGSVKFFEAAGSLDKKFLPLQGMLHEIFNEQQPDRYQVFSEVLRWLDQHC